MLISAWVPAGTFVISLTAAFERLNSSDLDTFKFGLSSFAVHAATALMASGFSCLAITIDPAIMIRIVAPIIAYVFLFINSNVRYIEVVCKW